MLVLGGGGSAGDNFAKCIRDEHDVIAADVNPYLLELSCADERVVLETRPADEGHFREITQVCRDHAIDFVHAQPDEEALFVSENREHFAQMGVKTLIPWAPVIAVCQDKLKCAQLLAGNGLAPKSSPISNIPRPWNRHNPQWLRIKQGAGSVGAILCNYPTLAREWIEYWGRPGSDWMVSEYLPGPDRSWTSVWKEGTLVAHVARERVQYMGSSRSPSGNTSTAQVQKLIHDETLTDVCMRAVQTIDYRPNGVYYVDTKGHEDGRQLVTEINAGRFNTTINAWADAGLNLPLIYLDAAQGLPIDVPDYADGYWIRQPDMGAKFVPLGVAAWR